MNAIRPGDGGAFMRRCLETALAEDGGGHNFDQAMARVKEGRAQLWVADDERGAIVTELLTYPNFKTLNYWLVGGELGSVLRLQPRIEDFARGHECRYVAALGRSGWARILPAYGWRVAGMAYRKAL